MQHPLRQGTVQESDRKKKKKSLYKRMASDTDLWMTANSKSSITSDDNSQQQSRFQMFLQATKEGSTEEAEDLPKPGIASKHLLKSYTFS